MTETERVTELVRRHPDWMWRPDHKRMLDRMLKRAEGIDGILYINGKRQNDDVEGQL